MILITKDEADYIRENSQNARITVTGKNKNSRQKKRYIDETYENKKLLRKFHNSKRKV